MDKLILPLPFVLTDEDQSEDSSATPSRRDRRRSQQALDIAFTLPEIDEGHIAWLAREFILCTLPHSDPGDVPSWSRRNGYLTLTLQPGYDPITGQSYGLPYGPLPRLLLAWIVTEALRTGSPRLEVGRSFAEFLRMLGLETYSGRGPRGDATRLRDQMRRLFHCLISFDYRDAEHRIFIRMLPVEGEWHFFDRKGATDLLNSRIELGQRFYQAITADAVPLDVRVLRFLKGSPLALDLYSTLTREAFRAKTRCEDRFIAWAWIHSQLGADYRNLHHFRQKCLPQLASVIDLCPGLIVSQQRGCKGKQSGLVVSHFSEPSAAPRRF